MSNAIRFLETLGQNPALSRLPADQLQVLIDGLDVDADQRNALRHADVDALNELVGGRAKMMCLIIAPNDEPQEGDAPVSPDSDAPQDEPGKDDDQA